MTEKPSLESFLCLAEEYGFSLESPIIVAIKRKMHQYRKRKYLREGQAAFFTHIIETRTMPERFPDGCKKLGVELLGEVELLHNTTLSTTEERDAFAKSINSQWKSLTQRSNVRRNVKGRITFKPGHKPYKRKK